MVNFEESKTQLFADVFEGYLEEMNAISSKNA